MSYTSYFPLTFPSIKLPSPPDTPRYIDDEAPWIINMDAPRYIDVRWDTPISPTPIKSDCWVTPHPNVKVDVADHGEVKAMALKESRDQCTHEPPTKSGEKISLYHSYPAESQNITLPFLSCRKSKDDDRVNKMGWAGVYSPAPWSLGRYIPRKETRDQG